jgi:hypothetical protein
MVNVPVLILLYKRIDLLEKVLISLEQLNPNKIYFHIHDTKDVKDNYITNNIINFIENLNINKEILYIKEYLGCRNAMYSGLKWISSIEEKFYVFEDDIILKPNSYKILNKEFKNLKEGIIKFGENSHLPFFWGWAITSNSVKEIINFNIEDYSLDNLEFRAWFDMKKRNIFMAWDDEIEKILAIKNIKVKRIIPSLTENIGNETTQEITNKQNKNYVIYKNGILLD